jgi:DNA-directed RNA polymerase specialized sigma24 family protein
MWAGLRLIAAGISSTFDFLTGQDREDAQSEAILAAIAAAGKRRGDAFAFFSTVIRRSIIHSCRRNSLRRSREVPLSFIAIAITSASIGAWKRTRR